MTETNSKTGYAPVNDHQMYYEIHGDGEPLILASLPQTITPFLMFVGEQQGKAEEAVDFYRSMFENSSVFNIERYGENHGGAGRIS